MATLWTNLALGQAYTAGIARSSSRDAYRTAMRVQRMADDTITDMEEPRTIAELEEIRKKEPLQATCDGLAGARVSVIETAVTPAPRPTVPHASRAGLDRSTLQGSDYHQSCVICPNVTGSSLEIPSSLDQQSQSHKVGTELFFPLIFCGYSSGYGNTHAAYHRCQMACIAGVESLCALGVTDFPVYGLVATGSRASIMMAWHSTKAITQSNGPKEARRNLPISPYLHACRVLIDVVFPYDQDMKYGCNILIDQNLVSFDLGEPLDAYRLAISLHRIHLAQHERLKKLLTTKHMNNLHNQIETATVPTWAMSTTVLPGP